MTSHIKDILLLGGVNTLISSSLAYCPQNIVISALDYTWFVIFVICLIKLVWTKSLSPLNYLKNNFPRFSVYLTYIGWLPYVVTLCSAVLIGINMYVENEDTRILLINTQTILEYVYVIGFIVSLIVATYQAFFKKFKTVPSDKTSPQ